MAEPIIPIIEKKPVWKWIFAVGGIMITLVIYDVLQLHMLSENDSNVLWCIAPGFHRIRIGSRFDGFASTFQDKLFKGYDMEIHNQIFYTTFCSCILSLSGLVIPGHLLLAVEFVFRHQDCLFDILLLSTVATASQFFISYTIRTFGALTFATIMTTRQLVSIFLSCVWFSHPLSWKQWIGAVIVFGTLYARSFLKNRPQKPAQSDHIYGGNGNQLNGNENR